ncbi:ATP-binding protein [Georgenia sp. H159]|uniref:ATP-binding protein n=1 Tax=Georgenia sp. H159 TaxID=3076115 RepID=UPI002D777F5C|nr:ATP-binding protein [Georgenia sp. H159]
MATDAALGQWSFSHVGDLSELRARTAEAASGDGLEQAGRTARQLLVLAVSELATNGLKYGAPPLVISLYRTHEGWLVDVQDGNVDEAPVPRDPVPGQAGGHGLRVIGRASTAWGWYREHTDAPRKHVWAHLPAAPDLDR